MQMRNCKHKIVFQGKWQKTMSLLSNCFYAGIYISVHQPIRKHGRYLPLLAARFRICFSRS